MTARGAADPRRRRRSRLRAGGRRDAASTGSCAAWRSSPPSPASSRSPPSSSTSTLKGIAALNLDLLTKPPRALGHRRRGTAGASSGRSRWSALAALIAIPFGVLAGVYVHEFARPGSAAAIRFAADVLVGVPSILIGIFVYHVPRPAVQAVQRVRRQRRARDHHDPGDHADDRGDPEAGPRDAPRGVAGARRARRWRTTSRSCVRTGAARRPDRRSCWPSPGRPARRRRSCSPLSAAAWSTSATSRKPMDALPLFIYTNARQPFEKQNEQAWGAAFLLLRHRPRRSTSSSGSGRRTERTA